VTKSTILNYTVIVCGGLVVLFGFIQVAVVPHAAADVIVPLVRNTPTDEAYILVANNLSRGAMAQGLIVVVLGVVIVVSAFVDRK
jgi:hypothetical protein